MKAVSFEKAQIRGLMAINTLASNKRKKNRLAGGLCKSDKNPKCLDVEDLQVLLSNCQSGPNTKTNHNVKNMGLHRKTVVSVYL